MAKVDGVDVAPGMCLAAQIKQHNQVCSRHEVPMCHAWSAGTWFLVIFLCVRLPTPSPPFVDVADVLGISCESAKGVVRKFLVTVHNSNDLAISLPNSPTELQKCIDSLSKLSSAFGIYNFVLGAIDG